MFDKEKIIAWLADTELYYRENGKTEDDLYQSKMANEAIILLKEKNECENCAMAIEDRQCIVHCKDCEHYRQDGYCKYNNHPQSNKEWYCADGLRRQGG